MIRTCEQSAADLSFDLHALLYFVLWLLLLGWEQRQPCSHSNKSQRTAGHADKGMKSAVLSLAKAEWAAESSRSSQHGVYYA